MKHRTATALKASIAPHSLHNAARAKIKNLDLEPIKFKLVKESGWTIEQADRVAVLYKGFLTLHAAYPDDAHVPTHEIDEMWHAHILDTAKYMADCHHIFGYYLHHFPYMGLRGEADKAHADRSFAATRARFIALCGLDPLAGDEIAASDCSGGCSSSSCGSGSSCSTPTDGGGNGHNDSPGDGGAGGGKKSSCTTYIPFNDPASGNTDSRRKTPPAANNRLPEKKPPLWRRILGLSGVKGAGAWRSSVDPSSPLAAVRRPGRAALLQLAQRAPEGVTKH